MASAAVLKIKTIFSQLTPLNADYPGFVEVWSYLDAFLSYEIQNSFFIRAMSNKAYIRDIWDGRNHLFSVKTGKFLTGLLPYVQEALQQYNIPYEIEDDRMEYPKGKQLITKGIEPRKYQIEAVEEALQRKRGIIFARPRSGKCVNFQSLLFTKQGMITFEELIGFHKDEKEFLCTIPLFGRQKEVKTQGVYCKGKANTIKLTTLNGYTIEGTPEHPILVWNSKILMPEFKRLDQLIATDTVIIQRGQNYFGNIVNLPKFTYKGRGTCVHNYKDCKIPVKMTKSFARLCAYLVGEGCLDTQPHSFQFSNADENLVNDYKQIIAKLFGLTVKRIHKDKYDYQTNSIKAKKFLEFLGIKGKAATKIIPKCIRQAPKIFVKEFLQVLFECEGYSGKGKTAKNLEISSASRELIRQLQIMLLNFGIISKTFPIYNKKYKKNYYRLIISGAAVQIFKDEIGFISGRKNYHLDKLCKKVGKGNNYDFISAIQPTLKTLQHLCIRREGNWWKNHRLVVDGWRRKLTILTQAKRLRKSMDATYITVRDIFNHPEFQDFVKDTKEYQKVKDIINANYYFDKVKSIESAENYVVDFYVPEDNSFFANGFINHNTIIEIMLVAKLNIFPVLSICQSIDIARQTINKFNKFLPKVKVGLIGDGECNIQPITVATIQSLSAAYGIKEKFPKNQIEKIPALEKKLDIQRLVETAKFVWYDESHHASANTSKFVLQNKVYSAEYILGCSGTPFREDNTNMLLEGLLGPIIYEIDYSKLIKAGYLVQPTIHLIKLPKDIQFSKGTAYASIYKQAIVENNLRNNTIANIAYSLKARGKTCMILVTKIKHGKILADLIPSAKFSYSKSKDRASLWHQLKVGKLPILITTLGDEGIDIPSLGATIIASGGESAIKVFQRLRCLTPYSGKNHAIVVDFLDPYKYLKKHAKKRERLYKSESSFRITYKEIKT